MGASSVINTDNTGLFTSVNWGNDQCGVAGVLLSQHLGRFVVKRSQSPGSGGWGQ